jgi:hypothetical protein
MAFFCRSENVIFPCGNVPIEITAGLGEDVAVPDNVINPFNLQNKTAKVVDNNTLIDVIICYLSADLDIIKLCALVTILIKLINVSKNSVRCVLKKHVDSTGVDTYIWSQLGLRKEYSFYQFNKRKWPVKKTNNIEWQEVAKQIGLVDKIYPHEARLANKNELDSDIDSDEDVEQDVLLKELDFKSKLVAREEKMRLLRINSNYAIYGIPDSIHILWSRTQILTVIECLQHIDKKLMIRYCCNLLVSRKYFDILKNDTFENIIKNAMKDHPRLQPFIQYCMSYSFYMLLKEERLLGKRIPNNSRAIFDEDEFRTLPVFDCSLWRSPYFTEIHCSMDGGCYSHSIMHLGGRRTFTSREEFLNRLSIVSGGMLDNINLSKYGAFLTGSALVPCVVKNPLETQFGDGDEGFIAFLNKFYPSYASMDEIRKKLDMSKRKIVAGFGDKKLQKILGSITNDQHFINSIEKVSSEFNTELMNIRQIFDQYEKEEKKLADLDIAITCSTVQEYDSKVKKIYTQIQNNLGDRKGEVYLYKNTTRYGFKWVLKGPGGARPIDFFKIWVQPQELLYRFHLNIVRFWWDGERVRGLASAVCAALTGINQWYRWFSNNKDPMSIVLKNMRRGYTTLLNTREIEALREYVNEVDKYKFLSEKVVNGEINTNHAIFGSDLENSDGRQYWDTDYRLDRLNITLTTNSQGKIVPPQIHSFEAIIDDLTDFSDD